MPAPLSIYIHFPYCAVKCPFCNLNAWERADFDEAAYANCIAREAETVANVAGYDREISTVFIGGGTPSLMSGETVSRILAAVSERWKIAGGSEISVEAHPLSCGREKLELYRAAGVNRISIGAQSFLSEKLERLGREHGAGRCFEAVSNAREAGFDNVSVDIIAGAPGETVERFEEDITLAADTGANHFSVYGLEIERGTRFYAMLKNGEITVAADDEAAEMAARTRAVLRSRGFERYEISSFATAETRCRHNINYWQSGDYIGLGAGAHSHMTTADAPFGIRWANPRNPEQYMEAARSGRRARRETLCAETGFSDTVMMGLRLADGINLGQAEKKFGVRADTATVDRLRRGGFLTVENGTAGNGAAGNATVNDRTVKTISDGTAGNGTVKNATVGTVKITEKGLLVANAVIAEVATLAGRR